MFALALLLACPSKDPGPLDSDSATVDSDSAATDSEPRPAYNRDPHCGGADAADLAPLGGFVALTFDDGPDLVDTPEVVRVLREYEVPATFFVLGLLAEDPEAWPLLQEMHEDPLFIVGSHSYDHPALWNESWSSFQFQVDETESILESVGISPRFFRFPYGASTCDQAAHLAERSYTMAGWHVDTWDWCYANIGTEGVCERSYNSVIPADYEADMIGYTLDQLEAFDGGVVLMHDIHGYTAASLEALILAILDAGFVFTNLDDAEVFPGFNGGERADLPWPGEPCAPSLDRCWESQYDAWCEPSGGEDEGLCVRPCAGYCFERDGASPLFCAEVGEELGRCLPISGRMNADCAALPGALEAAAGGHGSQSGASTVCWPEGWEAP